MSRRGEGSFNPYIRKNQKTVERIYLWFQRNEAVLLSTDIVCISILFLLHFSPSVFEFILQENLIAIQILAILLISPIALSVVRKGTMPLVIFILGAVLIHNSMILPYYSQPEPGEASFGGVKFSWTLYTATAVSIGTRMNFLLGVSMAVLSIILSYRPSLLFARNRPPSSESEWLKYPLWHDHTLLADGRAEYSIPVKRLLTDEERYILWRYEYILANIYGEPHLVNPEGHVPKYSTSIYRDKETGRIIGKARYNGFFV
ncbi:MAG: hypothetical protein M3270_04965 [Thermoproteota archaeon]|nr:hypothetical protein [Thermoproteota archaeon]